jgi:Ni/Co efflux regulator RcnB
MRHILIAAAIALGAAATPAAAGEIFAGSAALDRAEATYVRHTREHRLWEMERTFERQERRAYRNRYDRGPRYDRGWGPPPHARAYGRRDRYYDNRW